MALVDRIIWEELHIHRGDTLPFSGAPWKTDTHRGNIVEIFKKCEFKLGAEIGVETGKFSRLMAKYIPDVKIICVDPWKAYNHNSQAKEDRIYEAAMNLLDGCNVEVMRMTSVEAAKIVPDNSLDFVYIDGLHFFDSVMVDIILWSQKVRQGGIVSGHDYVPYYQFGVIQAVNAYTQAHGICNWYITCEKVPSFLWVKP